MAKLPNIIRRWKSLSALLVTGIAVPSSIALSDPVVYTPVPVPVTPMTISTARMTRFNPETDGLRFRNTFLNVTGVFDITTAGLCGGMAYAVLDYFNAHIPAPKQSYVPISGTTLESYIYGRQLNALEAHMDKWVELHGNPFGARNSEFFNWGLQGTGGGRLQELRAKIDAGQPVPLGLKSMSANPGEDHVVLAYGYDMGRYRGDLGANKEDLKIFLYEPNFGARKITLVPKPAQQAWCYIEEPSQCWRTYFVQQNYHAQTPPRIADRTVELQLDFRTGGDDLRGGNDNVNVKITLADGRVITANNVNKGKRWIDGSVNSVGISLPDTVRAGQIRSILVGTAFRGGFDGDNWNMERLNATLLVGGAAAERCNKAGTPLIRFTGDVHEFSMPMPC